MFSGWYAAITHARTAEATSAPQKHTRATPLQRTLARTYAHAATTTTTPTTQALAETKVALQRMEKFLLLPEQDAVASREQRIGGVEMRRLLNYSYRLDEADTLLCVVAVAVVVAVVAMLLCCCFFAGTLLPHIRTACMTTQHT
jgi:hypothetical protein